MIVFSNSKSYELTAIDKIMENNSLLLRDIFRRYMNILYSTIIVINKFEIDGISFNFNKSEMFEKTFSCPPGTGLPRHPAAYPLENA